MSAGFVENIGAVAHPPTRNEKETELKLGVGVGCQAYETLLGDLIRHMMLRISK